MQKNKGIWSLLGFLLLSFALLSIIFSMVGLQFSFMQWIYAGGRGQGFLIRIIMVMTGFIILYLSMADFKNEE